MTFDPSTLPLAHRDERVDSVFDVDNFDADFEKATHSVVPAPYLHSIALIRRDLFARVQFDPRYGGNGWREETDFYLAATRAGARIFFTPDVACFHLRGPICAAGGQRINRIRVEYYAWRNTRRLVAKHWPYLRDHHGFRGTVDTWTLSFFARRQWRQLRRILKGRGRSTFSGAR
jgi:GT2 family glycosyltransferase